MLEISSEDSHGVDQEAVSTRPGYREKHVLTASRIARCSLASSTILVIVLLGVVELLHQPSEARGFESSSAPTLNVSYIPSQADPALRGLSSEAGETAQWVIDSGNNRGMPFVIVDKIDAKAFVFGADGQLHGSAPVLLGLAPGDTSVPGIGDRALSRIRPDERTTPAGRFVASLGRNMRGKEILWVDYVNAISLHPVITTSPEERRAERLATPTPLDNRISYGCINVPPEFFHDVVSVAFAETAGIVYVLPETASAREFFSMD
jgi:hypothetical protein